jgi:carboxymethylenebutenolidase
MSDAAQAGRQGQGGTGDMVDLGGGLQGYYARPEGAGPAPGIVVFIEAFGLNDHFKRLAGRLADAGYAAIVPDLYHGDVYSYGDLNGAIGKLKTLNDDQVMEETGRALDFLSNRQEIQKSGFGCVGFCMGGRFAFLANAAQAVRMKAAVSFYGGGIGPEKDMVGRKPLLDRAGEMRAPILLFYGTEDQSIAPDEHGRVTQALSTAHKEYEMIVFAGAGHGFFCEDRQSFDERSAEESWRMMLDFYERTLRA